MMSTCPHTSNHREDFRVAAYLAKSIAYMTLEPYLVEVGLRVYSKILRSRHQAGPLAADCTGP